MEALDRKRFAVECIGAFALVFAGIEATVINDVTVGTITHVGVALTFSLVVLTWILMLVIRSVSTGAQEKGITAGVAVGSVIGLGAVFAGPISGASTVALASEH